MKKFLSIFTLIIGVLAFTSPAIAQDANANVPKDFGGFFESVPNTDFSKIFLQQLVPSAFNEETGNYSALVDTFTAFNLGLLIMATALIGWHTLVGVVSTAHEGKVLGQRWHQIWAPVRVVMGIGGLVPLPGIGLCAAQLLVVQIAMWGIGFADTVWKNYVDAIADEGKVAVTINIPKTYDTIKNIATTEVCYAQASKIWGYEESNAFWRFFAGSVDIKKPEDIYSFNKNSYQGPRDTNSTSSGVKYGVHTWSYGDTCGEISVTVYNSVDEKRAEIIKNMISKIRPEAEKLAVQDVSDVDKFNNIDASLFFSLKNEFDEAMYSAAVEWSKGKDEEARKAFIENAKEAGWSTAATWYMTLSRISGEVVSAATAEPDYEYPNYSDLDKDSGVDKLVEKMNYFGNWWDNTYPRGVQLSGNALKASSDSNPIVEMFSFLLILVEQFSEIDAAQPLVSNVNFGHNILWTAWAVTLSGATAQGMIEGSTSSIFGMGASLLTGGPSFLKGFLSFFSPLIYVMVSGLFMIGAMHAYVLPMMPYIMWLFAITGWITFILEALVAAPIWALAHCRMDGAELIDQGQKTGYMLSFNLFLRPVLMLLGLILSMSAYSIVIDFMNRTAFPAITSVTAGSVTGIVGALVLCAILTYLHFQLAVRTFSLIHMVPDRVSRWFGAGGENLGEESDTQKGVSIVGGVIAKGDTFGRFAANRNPGGKPSKDGDEPGGAETGDAKAKGGGGEDGGAKPTSKSSAE